MLAQNQDLNLRTFSSQQPRRFYTVQPRHTDIQKDEIGPKLLRLLNRIHAVLCFTANLPVFLESDQSRDTAPDRLFVVYDENSQMGSSLFC